MSNTAARLASVPGLRVRHASVIEIGDGALAMARVDGQERVVALAPHRPPRLRDLEGEIGSFDGDWLLVGPPSSRNLSVLRRNLPWLMPRTLGLERSFGFGDRLGLATPGHIRALRAVGGQPAPIFAQQSIREMERTRRTPAQVLDDASWGVFAEGWREGFGADADHLKTTADVDACVDTGYTFFTFDPGAHVDPAADSMPPQDLRTALDELPWIALEDSHEHMLKRYRGFVLDLDGGSVQIDLDLAMRAAVKYGRAVAHTATLYRHLRVRSADADVEVSVDETETPTTPAQHVYIASELRRLGVYWVSLAPRFVGRFEKGIDYLGDLSAFEADAAVHAAIARRLGPYKLSLHSGSDKLRVYPALARQAGTLLHVKTAGTSYLEALRTVAALDPGLFREIYGLGLARYEHDRASYHVSADLGRMPPADAARDTDFAAMLDDPDARQVLHVTFGSALARYGERLRALLEMNPEVYTANLERHFIRHLTLLTVPSPSSRA
jgi:tagaturonate epimerase